MASRIASLTTRLPRPILVLAAVLTLGLGIYAGGVPGKLALGGGAPPGSESADVNDTLAAELGYEPQPAYVLMLEGDQPVSSAASGLGIDTVSAHVEELDGVGAVLEGTPRADGLATTLSIHMVPGASTSETNALGERLGDSLDPGALTLTVAGSTAVAEGARDAVLDEAPALLLLVLPLLFLLLAGALGWRPALAAVLGAALAAATAISLLGLVDAFTPLNAIAVPAAGALAAVLAVESSAGLLHRYREESATLGGGAEALEYSLHVVLKGTGVAIFSIALIGGALLVMPLDWVRSIGAGVLAAAVVPPLLALLTMAATIALRPAAEVGTALPLVAEGETPDGGSLAFKLLLILGRGRSRGFVAIVPILIVAALALPLRDNAQAIGLSGFELPVDQPAATTEATLAASFGAGVAGPIDVLTDGPAEAPTVTIYRDEVSGVPGVNSVALAVSAGLLATFDVTTIEPPGSLAARRAFEGVAAVGSPSPRRLGGSTAELADSTDRVASDLPLALLVALLGTAALWSILFRSGFGPLLALCAAIAPLAGLAAAIAVFANGRFTGLLDYTPAGGLHLESYVVIGSVLLAIGLSRGAQMATALREERVLGGGAAGSLARAGILTLMPATSATLVGVALAGVWIGSDLVAAQEIGLGLAAGLIADLVLVRMLLAPAAARLSI